MAIQTLNCPISLLKQEADQSCQDTTFACQTFEKVDDIPIYPWYEVVPEERCLLRYEQLKAIESSCEGMMSFRYVLIFEEKKAVGFAYFQIFEVEWSRVKNPITSTDLTHPIGKSTAKLGQYLGKQAMKSGTKVMVCGNSFLSGEYGFCFKDMTREQGLKHLVKLSHLLRKNIPGISAVLLKDLQAEDNNILAKAGYQRFFADPNMILTLSPEWQSFEDYVQAMSSKYRQRLRSAYKKSKRLESRWLSADEVKSHEQELQALFSEVLRGDRFSLVDVPTDYFSQIKTKLKENFWVKAYYLDGKMVAFFSALKEGDRLDAHYIGYETDLNNSHKLYQRMLYDLVQLAFATQSTSISYGRTAMEIKSCVGASAAQLGLFLRISNPIIRHFSKPLLQQIGPDSWHPRHPFKESPSGLTQKSFAFNSALE